ncbi:hypothetical protein EON79_13635, partial [bacterium]
MAADYPRPVEESRFNPWTFVPILYFMQAIPVTIVQEVATVVYKDLGIDNAAITKWTALIALPWALQMLLGPLVELNATKRRWIVGGQLVIAIGLILAAFALATPNAFAFSLTVLGFTAVASALCNIATDGFYLLSMAKDQQAAFAGVQTTCYRLGRLFCTGILVLIVGLATKFEPLKVVAPRGGIQALQNGQVVSLPEARLSVAEGKIVAVNVGPIQGEAREEEVKGKAEKKATRDVLAPAGTYGLRIDETGTLQAVTTNGLQKVGRISEQVQTGVTFSQSRDGWDPRFAWTATLAVAAVLYALGMAYNHLAVPRPALDVASEGPPGETGRNVARTLWVLALGVGGYFLGSASLRLLLHGIDATTGGGFEGWRLKPEAELFFLKTGGVTAEWIQFGICLTVVLIALAMTNRTLRG